MGMGPILSTTLPVKKIKGAARQLCVVTFGVNKPNYGIFVLKETRRIKRCRFETCYMSSYRVRSCSV